MKGVLLILCAFILGVLARDLNDDQRQKVDNIHRECQADPATHFDEEKIKKAYRGEKVPGVGPHILCMSRKFGFQKENGDIDTASLKDKLGLIIEDEAKLKEVVASCGIQQATPEETAIRLVKCFFVDNGDVLKTHYHS